MKKSDNTEKHSEPMFAEFTNLVMKITASTDAKIDKLSDTVQLLIQTDIRAEERHIRSDERSERNEKAINGLAIKLDILSDNQKLMSKDIESSANFRSVVIKILIGVAIILITSAILFLFR